MDTKQLKQKILDLAIRGKLVPQDPNDEPASVLLERIRKEKEQLVAAGKLKKSKAKTSDTPHYENVPFEIPSNWVYCKLGEICHIAGRIGFRGYTKADLVHSGGAITLSPSNIVEGQMNYDNCTFISWEKYEESPEIQIQNGDILLVKTGSSYGKCALVQNLPQKATINPQFVTLKYIGCSEKYLTYALQSAYARRNYENFVMGTAIPTFTQVDLGNMIIPMPPMLEQLRIVNEVESWFSLIEEIEANKTDLQNFIQQTKSKVLSLAICGKLVSQDPNDEPAAELLRRINPAFKPCDTSHYENLPQGWCVSSLKVAGIEILNGYAFQSKNYVPNGIKVIRITNVQDGYIVDDDPKYYPISTESEIERYMLHEDDLLMSLTGNVGRVGFLTKKMQPAALNQRVGCVRGSEQVISKKYLYYFLQTDLFKRDCLDSAKGVAQLNISTEWLKSYKIPIPPKAEQTRITDNIEKIFSAIDTITAEL